MRYLFVIIMIALLPLRGWAGHVMAVDMAGQQIAVAQKAVATHASKDSIVAMPADCLMLAQVGADKDSVTSNAHCNCDSCELCLALASVKDTGFLAATFTPHTAPQASSAGFSSADRATSLKPPIY
ncbi:MAG: hypothetical protein H7228_03710 [Polaromonas sp.]|nr:hypothetical protein [Polaromonas sp.]